MLGLGTQELIIIFMIIMVLFGASRLPEIGSGVGKAIKNFKKATSEPDEIDVTPKNANNSESQKETDKEAGA
jgi:sec-independent protein translocase protein TatA